MTHRPDSSRLSDQIFHGGFNALLFSARWAALPAVRYC